jgi:hypothetical protein
VTTRTGPSRFLVACRHFLMDNGAGIQQERAGVIGGTRVVRPARPPLSVQRSRALKHLALPHPPVGSSFFSSRSLVQTGWQPR